MNEETQDTLDTPRFETPIPDIACPVITGEDHHGYRHIVAYHVSVGATERGLIGDVCDKAKAEGAPVDAVYKMTVTPDLEGSLSERWITVSELTRPADIEMIERYVEAMTVYEAKLAEHQRDRFEAGEEFTYTLTFPSMTTVTIRAASLAAAHVKLAPADGRLHHEVQQVEPAFPGTMRVQLDRPHAELVATDDPGLQQPPARRMPLST